MWTWDPKKDENIQKAVSTFLSEHNYVLTDDAVYKPIIDGVDIIVSGVTVLMIGLPPVSDYSVRETKYTERYLRQAAVV